MKLLQHNTPAPSLTTLTDVICWKSFLDQLHARLAPYVARPEPYQRMKRFLQGLLSSVPRKNGCQLAEQAPEATPYGIKRFLSQAACAVHGVPHYARALALEHL